MKNRSGINPKNHDIKIKDGQVEGDRIVRLAPPLGPLAEIVHSNTQFQVVVCGRRVGKTGQGLRWLLKRALQCPSPEYENWYIAPTKVWARRVAWLRLKNLIPLALRGAKPPNETRYEIELVNGNRIRLVGADKPSDLVGNAIWSALPDEYGAMKADTLAYIMPAIADVKGHLLFLGTPRGRNHFYKLYQYGLTSGNPKWKSYPIYKTIDSPWVTEQQIQNARSIMDPLLFAQEFEGSFENYRGKVYNDFLSQDAPHGNLTIAEFNPEIETYCGLDFGWTHPVVAAWMQYDRVRDIWYLLRDVFARSQVRTETLIAMLHGKPVELSNGVYQCPVPREYIHNVKYIAGHEANIKRGEANGANMKKILRAGGIFLKVKFHYLAPSLSSVRAYILNPSGERRFLVDKRGNDKPLHDLEAYHYPEKDGVLIGEEPVKDGSDDIPDAIRYVIDTITPLKQSIRKKVGKWY